MVDGARVQGKCTFWRRPNLDVFMHSYPCIYASCAISIRADFDAANGPDHDPICFQIESNGVWLEKIKLREIGTITLSGFKRAAINGVYVRETINGKPVEVQGNPVYWNTTRKYFIYAQALNLSRVAIAGKMDYEPARQGDNPAFAYVDNTKGWCEHDGIDYVTMENIDMKISATEDR